jgi:hypothetical protein
VALPIATAGATLLQARLNGPSSNVGKWSFGGWRAALATVGVLGLVGLVLTRAESGSRTIPNEPEPRAAAPNTAPIAVQPHLLFRHTGPAAAVTC